MNAHAVIDGLKSQLVIPMPLTEIRKTQFLSPSGKKLPAWVAHHRCGWSSKMYPGYKEFQSVKKAKTITATPGYHRVKLLLTIHRRVCGRRTNNN